MITVEEAKKKIRVIDPNTSKEVEQLLFDVLDRKKTLEQEKTYSDPLSRDYIYWIENRLAQKHLGYLDPSQVNQTWGGSTTEALAKLAVNYNFAYDKKKPVLGSSVLNALLDGTIGDDSLAPSMDNMKKLSYDWFKALFLKHKYVFSEEKMQFNVLGVRGYLLANGEVPNVGDKWNDTIFLIWKDSSGKERIESFVCSVDPGLYYYHLKPMNPSGCAHLVEGQYKYRRGLHGASQYPAFVQADVVTVARTNQANFNDRTKRDTGYFAINIHAGYEFGNESVYNSSAGCQVLKTGGPSGWSWKQFYGLLNQDTRTVFYYTLMNSSDLK